ncbi:MAG: inositol monophosphatase, partial [Akkermansia sp.]
MTTYSHEMRVALIAVKEAGAFLKMHFGEEQKVDQEGPHDLKLEIDRLAQNLIVARLVEAFPEYAVLGEEAYVGGSDN